MEFEGVDLNVGQKRQLIEAAGGKSKAADWIVTVTKRSRDRRIIIALWKKGWANNATVQGLTFGQALARLRKEAESKE